jgi:nucleotide-binding universal stress UspA family protein
MTRNSVTVTTAPARGAARTRPGDNVLVGVDGSPASRAALRWATQEADLSGVGLTVCLVDAPGRFAKVQESHTYEPLTHGKDILARAVAGAAQHLGNGRVFPVLAHGEIARVLAMLSHSASVLTLGTHGYFGYSERLFPPTALRVIAHAACPVVVHSQLAGVRGPFAGHVVVGVDGSAAARTALEFGFAHAAARGVPVAAVTVSDAPISDFWTDDALLEKHFVREPSGEAMLTEQLEPLRSRYPGVPVKRAVFGGRVPPALLRAGAGATLLVVGDRGRGGAARTLLGSVAEEMVAAGTCPVAVIPAALHHSVSG